MPSKSHLELSAARAFARKDYARGLGHLQALLERVGENPNTLHAMAICCERIGRDQEALDFAARAIAVDPGHFPSLQVLSQIHFRLEDHRLAVGYVERSLEHIPAARAGRMLGWGRALQSLLRTRIAGAADDQLGDLPPKDREWVRWAREYLQSREARDAREADDAQ